MCTPVVFMAEFGRNREVSLESRYHPPFSLSVSLTLLSHVLLDPGSVVADGGVNSRNIRPAAVDGTVGHHADLQVGGTFGTKDHQGTTRVPATRVLPSPSTHTQLPRGQNSVRICSLSLVLFSHYCFCVQEIEDLSIAYCVKYDLSSLTWSSIIWPA